MNILKTDIAEQDGTRFLDLVAYSPTLGWKDVALSKLVNIVPPADGIEEFTLTGTPPCWPIQLPSIQTYPLKGDLSQEDWFRGVRIKNTSGQNLITLRSAVLKADPIGDDTVFVSGGGLDSDKLIVEVGYSGGCKTHDFQLSWDGSTMESNPPQVILTLSHNANGDTCKALVHEKLQFDLSEILPDAQNHVIFVESNATNILVHRP